MSRTASAGSDYLSIGVLAQVVAAVREALASCGRASLRQPALPARGDGVGRVGAVPVRVTREVLRCLMEGLRWVSSDATRVSANALGVCAVQALRAARVEPVADPATPRVDGARRTKRRTGRRSERRFSGRAAFPPGSPDGAGGGGDARGVRVAGRVCRIGGGTVEALCLGRAAGACRPPAPALSTGADLLWRRQPALAGALQTTGACCGARGECPVRVCEYRLDDPSDTVGPPPSRPGRWRQPQVAALYHERGGGDRLDEVKTHILGPGAILRARRRMVCRRVHGLNTPCGV